MEPPVLARGGLRILQHVSYGFEPVGSMPLSYEFSTTYIRPFVIDPSYLETAFSEYSTNHFDNVARCAGIEMDVRGAVSSSICSI